MGNRSFPKRSSLKRRVGICKPKIKIVVVCEGANTEPTYFKEFKQEHANQLVELVTIGAAGVPVTIVNKAIEEQNKLKREARRSKNSFDKEFQVWGVFDVDEHPHISEAKVKARDNNIKLAISNPCFELWPFLHLCDHDRPTDRHYMQKCLKQRMPKYDPHKNKQVDYVLIASCYEEAKNRAIKQLEKRASESIPQGNPSTNVFMLTEKIIENGKAKIDCQSQ